MAEGVLSLLGALARATTWEEVAEQLAASQLSCYWLDRHGIWQAHAGRVEDAALRTHLHAFQGQGATVAHVLLGEDRLVPLWVRGRLLAVLRAQEVWLPALADMLVLWADARQVAFTHHARTLLHNICGLSQTAHEGARLLWEEMPPENTSRPEMGEVVEDLRVVVKAAQQLVDLVEGAPDKDSGASAEALPSDATLAAPNKPQMTYDADAVPPRLLR